MEQEPKDTKILEMPSQGNPEEKQASEVAERQGEIAIDAQSPQVKEKSPVAKMSISKRAARIRHLVRLGMNGSEICHKLGITRSQYRHAVTWMTQHSFSSNAMAFERYRMGLHSRLEIMELDLANARNDGDHRAVAAFQKIGLDAWKSEFEMAIKLGITATGVPQVQDNRVIVMIGGRPIEPLPVGLLKPTTHPQEAGA